MKRLCCVSAPCSLVERLCFILFEETFETYHEQSSAKNDVLRGKWLVCAISWLYILREGFPSKIHCFIRNFPLLAPPQVKSLFQVFVRKWAAIKIMQNILHCHRQDSPPLNAGWAYTTTARPSGRPAPPHFLQLLSALKSVHLLIKTVGKQEDMNHRNDLTDLNPKWNMQILPYSTHCVIFPSSCGYCSALSW